MVGISSITLQRRYSTILGDYDGSQEKIILEQEKIIKELSTKIAELEVALSIPLS